MVPPLAPSSARSLRSHCLLRSSVLCAAPAMSVAAAESHQGLISYH